MFVSRDRRPRDRYAALRIGLIFLAAGLWLGGLITDQAYATGAAIVVLVVALVLQMIGRRRTDG